MVAVAAARVARAQRHTDLGRALERERKRGVAVAEDSGVELQRREVQRGERARARGVGHEVRSAQVEAVRDATRDDVAEQAREGALLPADIVVGDNKQKDKTYQERARPEQKPFQGSHVGCHVPLLTVLT